MDVVVIGGGLTGLATAWRLRDRARVTVLEATPRIGGQIDTVTLADAPFDVGADAFLVRQPHADRLVREVGFGDADLVAPATGQVRLWLGGRLRSLPAGTVLGVPTDLRALARAGVLSPAALARVAAEPAVPRREVAGDRSVAELVGERFGRGVAETLVEPLLGGVYAGRVDQLSAAATLPPVWKAATEHRSLLAGLRAHRERTAVPDGTPVFGTLRGGLSRLVERLEDDLGGAVHRRTPVTGLDRVEGRWRVTTEGDELLADQVVLAVPARHAARLVAPSSPAAARELASLRAASVATVALAYPREGEASLPPISGVLVPRTEGRLTKAITAASRKWPHHADRPHWVLRASVGRIDDDRHRHLDDEELARRVDAEVRWVTGLRRPATAWRVRRWDDALPQYDVGHLEKVDRIRHELGQRTPGLHLAGAAFDGVGLASRAAEAERLAHTIVG